MNAINSQLISFKTKVVALAIASTATGCTKLVVIDIHCAWRVDSGGHT